MSEPTITADEFKEALRPMRVAIARLPENKAAEDVKDLVDKVRDGGMKSIEQGADSTPAHEID